MPPAMAIIVRRLLAKIPMDRYQSITDVRRDLAALSGSGVASSIPAVSVAGRGSTRFPLVGREAERATLLAGLDEAVAGRGSFVMIAGEPGIGKTRLTADILAAARRRGIFCLVGHCYEMEGAPPYVPFVEMLRYSARHVPPAAFRAALGDAASGVAKLMPELRTMFPDIPEPPPLPADQQRRFLFNAYLSFVRRSCSGGPIAVVLEDLHWADEPTLMLMQHLVAATGSMPLFTIGTYRDVELGVTRPFARTLEALLRERRIARLTLRRLPVDAVESMLASLGGHPPPPSLARVIFDDTEGNPFFVEEVFQHLAEEGKLFDEGGRWRKDLKVRSLEVPEGVRLVIGRRLQRLSDAARAVLTSGAIVGRVFSLRVLEAVERSGDADVVLEAIEEAGRAHLLVAEPSGRETRYRFAHELIRQTLVDAVSLPRRQRQHARIAEALERVYAASLDKHASALAHHLYQAGAATDADKTTKYPMLAATQARAAAGIEEALAHLDNALALWDGERNTTVASVLVERGGVLLSLAREAEGMRALQQAVDLYDELGDVPSMLVASLRLAGTLVWHARHREVLPVTSRALARLGPAPAASLRCRLLIYNALADIGSGEQPQRALDTMAEVLRLQQTIDDPVLEQECVAMDSHVHYEALHLEQSAVLARRAGALARAQNDLWGGGAVNVESIAAATEIHMGRLPDGVQAFTILMADAERAGHLPVAWVCRTFLASARLVSGELEAARRAAGESRRFALAIRTPWLFLDDVLIGMLEYRLGRPKEAIAHLRAAVAAEPPTFWSGISRAYLFYVLALEQARIRRAGPACRVAALASARPSRDAGSLAIARANPPWPDPSRPARQSGRAASSDENTRRVRAGRPPHTDSDRRGHRRSRRGAVDRRRGASPDRPDPGRYAWLAHGARGRSPVVCGDAPRPRSAWRPCACAWIGVGSGCALSRARDAGFCEADADAPRLTSFLLAAALPGCRLARFAGRLPSRHLRALLAGFAEADRDRLFPALDFAPEPLLSVPFFFRCIADLTRLAAARPVLRHAVVLPDRRVANRMLKSNSSGGGGGIGVNAHSCGVARCRLPTSHPSGRMRGEEAAQVPPTVGLARLCAGALVLGGVVAAAHPTPPRSGQLPAEERVSPFIVEPYLQLGDVPKLAPFEPVRVLWQTVNEPGAKWSVDVRQDAREAWPRRQRERPCHRSAGRTISPVQCAAHPASTGHHI